MSCLVYGKDKEGMWVCLWVFYFRDEICVFCFVCDKRGSDCFEGGLVLVMINYFVYIIVFVVY